VKPGKLKKKKRMLFGMTRRIVQRSIFKLLYSDFKVLTPSAYCRNLVLALYL